MNDKSNEEFTPVPYRKTLQRAGGARWNAALSERVRRGAIVPAGFAWTTAEELLSFLRDPKGSFEQKDALLLGLLKLFAAASDDAEIFELFVAAFWPALVAMAGPLHGEGDAATYGSDGAHDEVWSLLIEAFLHAIGRYPITRLRARVAANVLGRMKNTFRGLKRLAMRKPMDSTGRTDVALDPEEDDPAVLAPRDTAIVSIDEEKPLAYSADELETAACRLQREFPGLDLADAQLFVHNQVAGRSIPELAEELGLHEDAAESRCRRVRARISHRQAVADAREARVRPRRERQDSDAPRAVASGSRKTGTKFSSDRANKARAARSPRAKRNGIRFPADVLGVRGKSKPNGDERS